MATEWIEHLPNRALSCIDAIVMPILQCHVLSILIFMSGTQTNILELYVGIISGFRIQRIACKRSFWLLLIYRADTNLSCSPSKCNYLIHSSRKFGWLIFFLSCNWLCCQTCGACLVFFILQTTLRADVVTFYNGGVLVRTKFYFMYFCKKRCKERCCIVFRIMGCCMLKIKLKVSSYRPCKHVANVPYQIMYVCQKNQLWKQYDNQSVAFW
jgi:hypothetical protein